MGLIVSVLVHSADIQDRDGARLVVEKLADNFPRLRHVWVDGGYAGEFVQWAKERANLTVEVVRRNKDAKGFEVLPRRWVVERTFGWFGRYRRLSKDYEEYPETSESMIYLAMTHVMIRRLAPC